MVQRTTVLSAADPAVWRCCAPGNTPTQPDVKTIQLTREFPELLYESECRLSPYRSLSLSPSVCPSAGVSLCISASSSHFIHGKQGKPEHTQQRMLPCARGCRPTPMPRTQHAAGRIARETLGLQRANKRKWVLKEQKKKL